MHVLPGSLISAVVASLEMVSATFQVPLHFLPTVSPVLVTIFTTFLTMPVPLDPQTLKCYINTVLLLLLL